MGCPESYATASSNEPPRASRPWEPPRSAVSAVVAATNRSMAPGEHPRDEVEPAADVPFVRVAEPDVEDRVERFGSRPERGQVPVHGRRSSDRRPSPVEGGLACDGVVDREVLIPLGIREQPVQPGTGWGGARDGLIAELDLDREQVALRRVAVVRAAELHPDDRPGVPLGTDPAAQPDTPRAREADRGERRGHDLADQALELLRRRRHDPPRVGLQTSYSRRPCASHGKRREVALDEVAVVLVGDAVEGGGRLRLPGGHLGQVAGRQVGARHRLVGGRDVPVGMAAGLVDRDAPAGVPQRRLRPTEHGVHARALPLAAGEVDRLADADLAPVIARGMGAVDHLVVLGRRSGRASRAASRCG